MGSIRQKKTGLQEPRTRIDREITPGEQPEKKVTTTPKRGEGKKRSMTRSKKESENNQGVNYEGGTS